MNKGFTLVELIAVISILALLVIITTPAYDSISKNINTRNYQSKQNTIKAQTLSYVEKYMKDEVYGGTGSNKNICFTVEFLIQTGIISSDDDKDEYILNEITNKYFKNEDKYIEVYYDLNSLKLKANMPGTDDSFNPTCSETETY